MPGDEHHKKWLLWWSYSHGLDDMLGLARESRFFTISADTLNPGMLTGLTKVLVSGHRLWASFCLLHFQFSPLYSCYL